MARSSRREIKDRPWGIIRMAKLRWPSSERSWHLETIDTETKERETSRIRDSLSAGSEVTMETESSVIPRNLSDVAGPIVVSAERGTPTQMKSWRSADSDGPGEEVGG